MQPGAPTGGVAGEVSAAARIEDIADRVEASEQPHAVVDEDGAVVGGIGRKAVVDVLVGRGTSR